MFKIVEKKSLNPTVSKIDSRGSINCKKSRAGTVYYLPRKRR